MNCLMVKQKAKLKAWAFVLSLFGGIQIGYKLLTMDNIRKQFAGTLVILMTHVNDVFIAPQPLPKLVFRR